MNNKWDRRFIDMARMVASWSKDPSTKCGAVIVRGKHIVSVGFNGFPAGCSDLESLYNDRETKYARVLHAEMNAILSAKQDLAGCSIYIAPMLPCARCTASIIQAGITTVVSLPISAENALRWKESIGLAEDMLCEANVTTRILE